MAQSDVTAEDVATAARSALYGALKQSTEPVATREHLHQVGEYQLQDVLLSEVFRVNESIILEAYAGFARLTGCRPGMAMNDQFDFIDPASEWWDKAPLTNRSIKLSAAGFSPPLQIGSERQPGTIWMEVMFDRKKGQ